MINKDEEKVLEYIAKHRVAAISTVDDKGILHSAAAYIYASGPKAWYMVSKTDTKKSRNLVSNPNFSAVIFDRNDNSTLQARGMCSVEEDADTIGKVMSAMAKIYGTERDWLPPVAKINAGGYVVEKLSIDWLRLTKFGGASAGSQNIFIEID